MSTIVAVLRAYCKNQAASVTQFQTERERATGKQDTGSQWAARWSLKTGLGPRLLCFSSCSLLAGSCGCKDEAGADTRDQEEYF